MSDIEKNSDLSLELGARYRYSSDQRTSEQYVDQTLNWHWITACNVKNAKSVTRDSGISGPAKRVTNGRTIYPFVVTTSAFHRQGTKEVPWFDARSDDRDALYPYWGETKPETQSKILTSKGNRKLLEAIKLQAEGSDLSRKLAPPVLVTNSESQSGGRGKGYCRLVALAVASEVDVRWQYAEAQKLWFWNLAFKLTFADLSNDKGRISMKWLNARRDPTVSIEDSFAMAPTGWKALMDSTFPIG